MVSVNVEGKDATLELHFVLSIEEVVELGIFGAGLAIRQTTSAASVGSRSDYLPIVASSMLKQTIANPVLNLRDGIPKLLRDGLPLQSFDRVRVGGGRHDDERHNSHGRSELLKTIIQSCHSRNAPQ